MKANELRIGNWVRLREHDAFIQIEQYQLCESELINVQPIPLTEDWFEKWEFYKDGEYWSKGIFDYKYCFKYRDWANNWAFYQEYTDSTDPKDDGIKYPISFDIHYVHQLQNLYFALTGEEL